MKLSSRLVTVLGACGVGIGLTLFLLAAVVNASATNTTDLPSWVTTPVDTDTSPSGRGNTSIAIDSTGKIHMSYASNQELRYATLSVATWITQVVDPGAQVFGHSLALDASNKPHIAYIALYPSATSGYLRYATLSGTTWVTQPVDDNPFIEGVNACQVSLAMDTGGRPHISYGAIPSLYYAVLTSTGWLTQTVDNGVFGYMCSALDVTDSGVPHIAYYDLGPGLGGTLKYAVRSGSSWTVQTVDEYPTYSDNGTDFGLPSTLRLDGNQYPHILYYDAPNGRLKYAVLSGTVWISDTIPSLAPVDRNFRGFMALGSSARPHVSFAGQFGQDLIYATLSGTQWISQTVDDSLGAGLANSIALSDTSRIAIGYLNTYLNQVSVAKNWDVVRIHLPVVLKQ